MKYIYNKHIYSKENINVKFLSFLNFIIENKQICIGKHCFIFLFYNISLFFLRYHSIINQASVKNKYYLLCCKDKTDIYKIL